LKKLARPYRFLRTPVPADSCPLSIPIYVGLQNQLTSLSILHPGNEANDVRRRANPLSAAAAPVMRLALALAKPDANVVSRGGSALVVAREGNARTVRRPSNPDTLLSSTRMRMRTKLQYHSHTLPPPTTRRTLWMAIFAFHSPRIPTMMSRRVLHHSKYSLRHGAV